MMVTKTHSAKKTLLALGILLASGISVSQAQADQLADIDVIVTYGNEDLLPALQADPLWSTLPAVKAGAVVEIGKGDALSAAVSPTALSIPWVLPQYVPLLEKAAAKVQ